MAKSKLRTALEEAMAKASNKVRSKTSSFQDNFNRGYENFKQQQQKTSTQRKSDYNAFQSRIVNRVRSEAPKAIDKTLSRVAPVKYGVAKAFKRGYDTGGVDRVKNIIKNDPGSLWIGRGFAEAPENTKELGRILGNEQLGEDVGFGLRGAGNLTPFNITNRLGLAGEETKRIQEANAPTTDRQQKAEDIGQALYGNLLAAPLSAGKGVLGAAKAVTQRAVAGGTLGLAITTVTTAATQGRLPTKDELTEGGISGVENSWQLAFTNAFTDKILGKFAATAGLTDDAINATFKSMGKTGLTSPQKFKVFNQALKQLFYRSLAEVPAENTLWTFVDQLDGDAKENFIKEWAQNLPGTIIGNVVFGVGLGGFRGIRQLNKTDIDFSVQALKNVFGDQTGAIKVDEFPQAVKGAIQDSREIISGTKPEVIPELPPKQAKEAIADQIEDGAIKEEPKFDPIKDIQDDMAKNLDDQKLEELLPKEEVIDPQKQLQDEVKTDLEKSLFKDDQIKPEDQKATPDSTLGKLEKDFESAREKRKFQIDIPTLKGKIKTAWSDKLYYAEKHDPELYLNMRLLGGGGDARTGTIIEQNLGGLMKQEADAGRSKDFSNLIALDRLNELVNRGFARHLSKEEIDFGFKELESKYSRPELDQMRANAQKFRGFLTTLLDQAEQVGLVSKEAADAARANNDLYVTLETIGQMERKIEKQGFLRPTDVQRGGQTFNVSKQEVLKRIGDSDTGIADPKESSFQYIIRTIDNIERNAILKDFVERRGAVKSGDNWVDPKTGEEATAIPLRQAENVRGRMRINSEIGELLPVRNRVARILRTKNKHVRQINTAINNLHKEGLLTFLKEPVKTFPDELRSSVTEKQRTQGGTVTTDTGDTFFVKDESRPVTQKLTQKDAVSTNRGAQSTKRFVESLIELPRTDIERIKRKLKTKDKNLNKLFDEIAQTSDMLNGIKDDIIDLRTSRGEISDIQLPPEGYGTINVFRDGIKEEWAVPQELESAIKNLDGQTSGTMIELYNKFVNQTFKQAVTSKNPVFALAVNPIKDVQNALFAESTEKGFKEAGGLVTNYIGGISDAFGLSKQRQNWLLAGGGYSSFLSSENRIDPIKTIASLENTGKIESQFKHVIKKPFEMLDFMSRSMEESTRLAKFNKDFAKLDPKIQEVVNNPYTPLASLPKELKQITLDSRNITQDFSRMGTAAQQVNKIVSFFNVGLQGTLRVGSMAKNNPGKFVASAIVLTAVPALMAFTNNKRFEDYKDLREYERRGSMIWIYKDRTPEEVEEKAPLHAFKIPLGQWNAPFYNIAEELFRFTEDSEPGAIDRLAKNLFSTTKESLSNMSPVDASSFALLPVKVQQQLQANMDFYSGMPIEPNYIDTDGDGIGDTPREDVPSAYRTGYYTGPTTKALGRITGPLFGLSPAQIDSIISTTTGGSGKTALALTDSLLGEIPETKNNPILKRFMAPRGGQIRQEEYEAEEAENKIIREEEFGSGINFDNLNLGGIFGDKADASEGVAGAQEELGDLPETTKDVKVLYDDSQRILKAYDDKRIKIQYGDYKSEAKRNKELKALDAERDSAQARIDSIEGQRPEQVFEIETMLHGTNHPDYIKLPDRADWAYEQFKGTTTAQEFEDMVNLFWEEGVLTGRSNGVAAYIKDVYGIDVSRYTGDDPATKKKVGSSSGSGKKIPKLSFNIPKIQTPKLNFNAAPGAGISGLFPTSPQQFGFQGPKIKVPTVNRISLPKSRKVSTARIPINMRVAGL